MSGREATGENGPSGFSQNPLSVPPTCSIHFAKPRDSQPQFDQLIEVNAHFCRSVLIWSGFDLMNVSLAVLLLGRGTPSPCRPPTPL